MKVIIAGFRNVQDYKKVEMAIGEADFNITEVVSGGARGADKLGELYAHENFLPKTCFPAYWEQFGKSAGYRRNEKMADYADALVAIWDGKSKGTKHMIDIMKAHKKPVYIFAVEEDVD